MINIYYKGRKIYSELSHEDAADILHEMAIESYEDKDKNIDLEQLDIEEII